MYGGGKWMIMSRFLWLERPIGQIFWIMHYWDLDDSIFTSTAPFLTKRQDLKFSKFIHEIFPCQRMLTWKRWLRSQRVILVCFYLSNGEWTVKSLGAEIAALCREAAICCLSENIQNTIIGQSHFDEALLNIIPRTSPDLLLLYQKFIEK